jgi:hypothetical protein
MKIQKLCVFPTGEPGERDAQFELRETGSVVSRYVPGMFESFGEEAWTDDEG